MKVGRHPMVTAAQCVELWRRYKAGETVLSIADELRRRSRSNIYRVPEATGGIRHCQEPSCFSLTAKSAGDGQCFGPSPQTLIGEHVKTEFFVHERSMIQNQRSENKYKSS